MTLVVTVPVTRRRGPEAGGYYPACLWDGLPFPAAVAVGRRWRFLLAPPPPDPAGRRTGEPLPALAARWPEVSAALSLWNPGPAWSGRVVPPGDPAEEERPFLLLAALAAPNALRPSPLPPSSLAEEACRLLCRTAGPPADLALLRAAASLLTVVAFPCMKKPPPGNIAARK